MSNELIPSLDNKSQNVVGIMVGGVEIPLNKEISFKEFVECYYEPLQTSFKILNLAKISGEYRTEWTDEELKNFIQESNYPQVLLINALRVNKSLSREGILQVIRQVDKQYKNFSTRQLGPQIGGIRSRTSNLKKEELIIIDSKKQIYSLNEKYRKRIKNFLVDTMAEFDS